MRQIYDSQNNRLIFLGDKPDNSYWDAHWNHFDFKNKITSNGRHNFVVRTTKRYLKQSEGPILEGGCGIGQNVYALSKAGYTR